MSWMSTGPTKEIPVPELPYEPDPRIDAAVGRQRHRRNRHVSALPVMRLRYRATVLGWKPVCWAIISFVADGSAR